MYCDDKIEVELNKHIDRNASWFVSKTINEESQPKYYLKCPQTMQPNVNHEDISATWTDGSNNHTILTSP
jgi:hypothetical protein